MASGATLRFAEQLAISIQESSQVGEARRKVANMLQQSGLSEAIRSNAAIVVNELANNLIRHAGGGEILFRLTQLEGRQLIDFWSIDRGPGIPNVSKALEDGFSTFGGAGTGLGAIKRLSSEFDLYTSSAAGPNPGPGTNSNTGAVLFSRIDTAPERHPAFSHFSFAGLSKPAPHEIECGDAWRVALQGDRLSLFMADGLGHGPQAALASEAAAAEFAAQPFDDLETMFARMHQRLRTTRGAAVAALRIEPANRVMQYLSVGNIAGVAKEVSAPNSKGLMSHNGTIGLEYRTPKSLTLPLASDSLVILHSDGLQTRWKLENYPGLQSRSPGVIAGVLYRDFTRHRDDATVAVVKVQFR